MSHGRRSQTNQTSTRRSSTTGQQGELVRSRTSRSSSPKGSVRSVASSASSGPTISPDTRRPRNIWRTPEHLQWTTLIGGRIKDVIYEAGPSPAKDLLFIVPGTSRYHEDRIEHTRFPFLPDRLVFGRLLNAFREATPSKAAQKLYTSRGKDDATVLAKKQTLAEAKEHFLTTYHGFTGDKHGDIKTLVYSGSTWPDLHTEGLQGSKSHIEISACPYTFEWYGLQERTTTTPITNIRLHPMYGHYIGLIIDTDDGTFSSGDFLDTKDREVLGHMEQLLTINRKYRPLVQAKFIAKYELCYNEGYKKLVIRSDHARKERSKPKKAWIEYDIYE